MPDREAKSHRDSTGLQRKKRGESAGRQGGVPQPLQGEAAKAEANEMNCLAGAEALILLERIVVAESARKAPRNLRIERQNPFEAWYLRVTEREKVRRKSERLEAAFGFAVVAAVLVLFGYLWGTWFAFHRFASGSELLPILFGGLIAFSFLFYKMIERRDAKS